MRTMDAQDFRVLEAVEKGMKDHAIVPSPLIAALANLRHGGTHKLVSSLLRDKLLSHERTKGVDGYRITNAGYDILALYNLKKRGVVAALGHKIGTGKESDIYLAVQPSGQQVVLKFHRLGRTSFRNVRKKRDYFGGGNKAMNQAHSWLFLSRLSALKEFAFMKALHEAHYQTPVPLAHNRHIVAMSLVRGTPLFQIYPKQLTVEQAENIYEQSLALAARLAQHGLVHCDLNEFNLLVDLSGIQALATTEDDPYVRHSGQSVAGDKSMGALSKPAWEQSLEQDDDLALPEPIARLKNGQSKPVVTLIDFPQMISTKHPNAQELYERDLQCLRRFFETKLHCHIPDDTASDVQWEIVARIDNHSTMDRLDSELRASGFSDNSMNHDLELYYFSSGPQAIASAVEEGDEDDVSKSGDDIDIDGDDDDESLRGREELVDEQSGDASEAAGIRSESDYELEPQSPTMEGESFLEPVDPAALTRDQLEELAKARVRKQLVDDKRKSRKKAAFRKRNTNKTYVKGKHVMADSGF